MSYTKRVLGLMFFAAASLNAFAQEIELWKSSKPWLCDRFFAKEDSETKAFKNALIAHSEHQLFLQKQSRYNGLSRISFGHGRADGMNSTLNEASADVMEAAFKIFNETLNQQPFSGLGSTSRSKIISWGMLNWFEIHERPYINANQVAKLYTLVGNEAYNQKYTSTNNADRLRRSLKLYLDSRERYVHAAVILSGRNVETTLVELMYEVLTPDDLSIQWNKLSGEFLNKDKSLHRVGQLKMLTDGSIKALEKLPTADKNQRVVSEMKSWVKTMKDINSVNWLEILDSFKALKVAALQMGISENDFLPISKAMKSVVDRWSGEARTTGNEVLRAPYGLTALPN